MHRYLAFIWDPDESHAAKEAYAIQAALAATATPWQTAYQTPGVLLMHLPQPRLFAHIHSLAQHRGVIVGSLYSRKAAARSRASDYYFDAPETQRIVESNGSHLVESYWGSYVAIFLGTQAGVCHILRDPTANLPCYHVTWGRIHVFFSDMEDLRRHIPMPLSINWNHIAATLLASYQLSRDCGIREIEDIPGGELLTLSKLGTRRTVLWHPAKFCAEDSIEDPKLAAQELRDTVLSVIRTLASEHSDILVRLSGGLDSSIVTSCLSQLATKPNVTCLNFYIATDYGDESQSALAPGLSKENLAKVRRVIGGADEREYARSTAEKCGFRLFERERRLSALDVRRAWTQPVAPRPSNYIYVFDEDDAETDCASASGATACFTGEGGDTVFYGTFRAIGALDYAYLHPLSPHLFHHVGATSLLSGESVARVLGKVVKYGILRRPLPTPFEPMNRPHLLDDAAANAVPRNYFHHPWMDTAPRLCPGKSTHVAGVAASVPMYHHMHHRERIAPSVHPLASQPVVETCLRIPTYVLLAGGISRGLARRVFQDLLPPEVARRTAKGIPIAFWHHLVRDNLSVIRESLMDGALVRERVLDRGKVDKYLTRDQPFLTVRSQQIMDYLACEAWLAQQTPRPLHL